MNYASIAAAVCLVWPLAAHSQSAESPSPITLSPVVVTATRTATSADEVATSISAVDVDSALANRLGANLSEVLDGLAGTQARNRQNYAQDEQLSIRGFGTRAPFGIVGVKLYVDGIPATRPDGQGQVSQLDLASAARVEVLRGPFSALYGNAAGGVVQVFTAAGEGTPQWRLATRYGSYGQWRESANARGSVGALGYNLDYTHFQTDGSRDHAAARRDTGNARLDWTLLGATKLTLLASTVSIPEAEDPLGLTRAQFKANPRAAGTNATLYNTRKSVAQTQAALLLEQPLPWASELHASGYYGHRAVRQFLATAPAAQASPLSAGGVIDLGGRYGGGELRLNARASQPVQWGLGLAYDRQNQRRRGEENFLGNTVGVQGALRRDEDDHVEEFAPFAQIGFDPFRDWRVQAGLRRTEVRFTVDDHFRTAANPDDSGRLRYAATTPVLGLLYRLAPRMQIYASWGEGFDAPTFNELSYRPDGGSGLNTALEAARTASEELGLRSRLLETLNFDAAIFQAVTRHEVVPDMVQGGRSTYRNASRTRRRGAEASLRWQPAPRWQTQASATWTDAVNRVPYFTCATTPCAVPNVEVEAGDRIAGVAPLSLYAALRYGADTGAVAGIAGRYLQRVPADSANRESAPDYGLVDLDAGYGWAFSRAAVRVFLRMENVFDADYVGSLIVNDARAQFYEAGPGRSLFGGVDVSFR